MLYCPAWRMILMRGCPEKFGADVLHEDGVEGQTARHLDGAQHCLEHGGRLQVRVHEPQSPFLMQLCASIFLRTGQEMCPGRQPHRNWNVCTEFIG